MSRIKHPADQHTMIHLIECDRSHQMAMAVLYHAECELRETLMYLHNRARARIMNGDLNALQLSHRMDDDVKSISGNITTLCQEVWNLYQRLSDQDTAGSNQNSTTPGSTPTSAGIRDGC